MGEFSAGVFSFLDAQASLAPTPVSSYVCRLVILSDFQRLWALTKRRDDIVVADMEVDMGADMGVNMVAYMMVDMLANMKVDMMANMLATKVFF